MKAHLLAFAALSLALAAPALATDDVRSGAAAPAAVKIAKGKAKKKKDEKPADKPIERPNEGLPRDPRGNEAPPADAGGGGAAGGMVNEVRRGMSRIEFDDRLIQGQTNKANAIYLFERRESALRSLLRKRTQFHEEIDETLE